MASKALEATAGSLAVCRFVILFAFVAIFTASEELKLAVAATSSASVAYVRSNDELKLSKSVTRVDNEPLAVCRFVIFVSSVCNLLEKLEE